MKKQLLSLGILLVLLFTMVVSLPALGASGGGTAEINIESATQTDAGAFIKGVLEKLQGLVGYLALVFVVLGGVLYAASAGQESLAKAAKACWTAALVGFVIVGAAPVFLKEITDIVGPVDYNNYAQARSLKEMALKAVTLLLSIAGSIGIIGLVIGAIMYATSYGDKNRADAGKKAITYSLVGIVVAGAAVAMLLQLKEFITGSR